MKKILILISVLLAIAVCLYGYQVYENAQIEKKRTEQQRQEAEQQRQDREQKAEEERARQEAQQRQASAAKELAKIVGEHIMDNYGGGQDLRTVVKEWSYDEYSSVLEVSIEVYWSGAVWRSNKYNVDGIVTYNIETDSLDFSRTYANQNIRDLDDVITTAKGIDMLFEALGEN